MPIKFLLSAESVKLNFLAVPARNASALQCLTIHQVFSIPYNKSVSRSLQGGAAQQAAKRRRENVEEAEIATTNQASVTDEEAESELSFSGIEAGTFVTEREFSVIATAMINYFRANHDPTTEMVFKAIKDQLGPPDP